MKGYKGNKEIDEVTYMNDINRIKELKLRIKRDSKMLKELEE